MLFACERCDTVDDTELASISPIAVEVSTHRFICSCCLSPIGAWHNQFPKLVYRPGVDIVCNRPSGIGLSCVP